MAHKYISLIINKMAHKLIPIKHLIKSIGKDVTEEVMPRYEFYDSDECDESYDSDDSNDSNDSNYSHDSNDEYDIDYSMENIENTYELNIIAGGFPSHLIKQKKSFDVVDIFTTAPFTNTKKQFFSYTRGYDQTIMGQPTSWSTDTPASCTTLVPNTTRDFFTMEKEFEEGYFVIHTETTHDNIHFIYTDSNFIKMLREMLALMNMFLRNKKITEKEFKHFYFIANVVYGYYITHHFDIPASQVFIVRHKDDDSNDDCGCCSCCTVCEKGTECDSNDGKYKSDIDKVKYSLFTNFEGRNIDISKTPLFEKANEEEFEISKFNRWIYNEEAGLWYNTYTSSWQPINLDFDELLYDRQSIDLTSLWNNFIKERKITITKTFERFLHLSPEEIINNMNTFNRHCEGRFVIEYRVNMLIVKRLMLTLRRASFKGYKQVGSDISLYHQALSKQIKTVLQDLINPILKRT